MKRSTRPPNAQERAELDSWLEMGMDIMGHYGVDAAVTTYNNLDAVYEAWVNDSRTEKPSRDSILFGLGTVLGNRLGHKHAVPWHMVTDEHGTDYAISIKGYEIYPMDFLAKRIATLTTIEPEFGFFTGMAEVSDTWQ
jgi:hypothetical protein